MKALRQHVTRVRVGVDWAVDVDLLIRPGGAGIELAGRHLQRRRNTSAQHLVFNARFGRDLRLAIELAERQADALAGRDPDTPYREGTR